jgi:hypothetical protein
MKHSLISAFLLVFLSAALPLRANSQPILPSEAPSVLFAPPVEELQPADGKVVPLDGFVAVRLVNKSNVKVKYQVLGITRQRILEDKAEVNLTRLPLPMSLTFRRIDNGFLKVTLRSSSEGVLDVELEGTADFDVDRISLWVRVTGDAYLN